MDSSKEYIQMCREAVEVQAIRKKAVSCQNNKGRFTWFSNDGGRTSIRIYIFWGTANWETHDGVWLPTQAQIQDIIGLLEYKHIKGVLLDFIQFSICGDNDFDSIEKLWLGFLMFKVYGKSWKDQKWVEDLI